MYQRWSRDGHVETIYLGTPSGNQTRIYDKSKELKKHNHIATLSSLVRIERTLRPQLSLKFNELPNLKNPFLGLILTKTMSEIPAPPSPIEKEKNLWTMFGHSVQVGDLETALALLPQPKRKLYRAHFEANAHPLWNPEAIWKLWPKTIAKLGLFNLKLFP